MRFKNWDVLLFPERSKVPVQEFKTTCHVVHDVGTAADSAAFTSTTSLLPTVTCFVPALREGQPFRLSIHSWETPEPSEFLRSYSRSHPNVVFEARVFIDGKLSGYRFFGKEGPWPTIIETGLTIDRNGDNEPLVFPAFHRELLTQNYWNAGDDLGRIKVVICEGVPRPSNTVPYERVKSIVAFSFQHAPLDVLESSSIAWPNATMWRSIALAPGTLQRGPRVNSDDSAVDMHSQHSHSPRRSSGSLSRTTLPPPSIGSMLPPALPSMAAPRPPAYDPFTDGGRNLHHWRQPSSSADISMPDYTNSSMSASRTSQSRQVTDPLSSDRDTRRYQSLQSAGAVESLCEALKSVKDSRSEGNAFGGKDDNPIANHPVPYMNTPHFLDEAGIHEPPPTANTASPFAIAADKENAHPFITRCEVEASQPINGLATSAGNTRSRVASSGAPKPATVEDELKTSASSTSLADPLGIITHIMDDKEN